MKNLLRSPARLLMALLFVAAIRPAHADGRADWQDYSWQKITVANCLVLTTNLACAPYHQKWDWKRNQWVDIAIAIDLAAGRLDLTQQLSNHDTLDDDDVCVTVLVLDGAGHNIIAHHQNWRMRHSSAKQESFAYKARDLVRAATIHIGSKQCRKGAHQDDAIYAAVRNSLQP